MWSLAASDWRNAVYGEINRSHWPVHLMLHFHWSELLEAPHSAFGLIPGLFGIYTKVFYWECPQQVSPDSRCIISYSQMSCFFSFCFNPVRRPNANVPVEVLYRHSFIRLFAPTILTLLCFYCLLYASLLRVQFQPLLGDIFGHLQFRKQRVIHSFTRLSLLLLLLLSSNYLPSLQPSICSNQ